MNYDIETVDTPITVALKLRVRQLEAENYALRNGVSSFPEQPTVCHVENLNAMKLGNPGTVNLTLAASWSISLDPRDFRPHAVGVARTKDGDRLEVGYYVESLAALTNYHAADALGRLHNQMIMQLAHKMLKFPAVK